MSFYGGAELLIVKLANYLIGRGIKNSILTLNISEEVKKELNAKTGIILPPPELRKIGNFIFVAKTLRRYLFENVEQFDVVNVHNFPAELSVMGCKKSIVWMCNEPPTVYFGSSFAGSIARNIVMKIDRFVVKNYMKSVAVADEFNAKRFEKLYKIKPQINYYGIDYDFFSKGNANRARKMFNLVKNDFTLLQVGMITLWKNQLESVKTLEKLKDKIKNIKLILAGKGENEYEKILRKYVEEHGLEKHVIFTGHLPRTIIRDLYKACNVALFPIKSQGGWLSPFEAMCVSASIVVSPLITSANIIRKNKLGIVTNNFSKSVMDIYNNPKYYHSMTKKAGLWVKKNLSWNGFCKRMTKCFEAASKI